MARLQWLVTKLGKRRLNGHLNFSCPEGRTCQIRPSFTWYRVALGLVFNTAQGKEGHAVHITKIICIIKMNRNILGVCRPLDEMYVVGLKKVGNNKAFLPQKRISVF